MTNLLGRMYDSLVRNPLERRRRIRTMFEGLPSQAEYQVFPMKILVRSDPGPYPHSQQHPDSRGLDNDWHVVHVKFVDQVTGEVIARRDSVYAYLIRARYMTQVGDREYSEALESVREEGLCCWTDILSRYPCTPEDDCWYGVDAIERPSDEGDSSAGSGSR